MSTLTKHYVKSPEVQYHVAVTKVAHKINESKRILAASGSELDTHKLAFHYAAGLAVAFEYFGVTVEDVVKDVVELCKRV